MFALPLIPPRRSPALILIAGFFLAQTMPGRTQHSARETEELRLAQGRVLAEGKEMRPWRFEGFKEPMQNWPKEVRGAFLELRCEDHKFSEAALIMVRDDFRIRAYPAKSLTPEDRTLAEKLEAERAAKLRLPPTKPYRANYKPYGKSEANITETDHFTFYHGNDQAGSGKAVFEDPEFLPRQHRWFEKVWTHLGMLGAPLPMAGDDAPQKINVYITGTGLAKHKDGFAFGGESVIMHPNALGPGSSVVIHEFTHSVQFYSKGYRDSEFVGWFWECHGNWSTHQFMPGYPPVLAHYVGRAHYELNSSRHNYGSWPFLQVLAEHPKFGPAFPYEIWPLCQRDERNKALEDPFQTIMRVGTERGLWKDGVAGFGDIIGQLAARMVAWDFQNQFYHTKEMRNVIRHSNSVPSHRVVLEPVADRAGWFRPIFSHAPRQYGVNLVDLDVSGAAVEVEFDGIVDAEEGSDWRVTLVASDALGRCRYSPTIRAGKVSLDARPGEKLTLAIAATPAKYEPLGFRIGYGKKRRYPYEVTFRGAKPASAPPLREEKAVDGAPHANGGGFVAKSAKVAPTAFVGPNARVLDGAEVSGNARVEDFAVVRQAAKVSGDAVIGGYARITDRARVEGRARVRGCARVGDQVTVTENARVMDYATVDGRGTVSGDVIIRGFGEIHLQPATPLTGGTVCGEDLEVHLIGSELPEIRGGMIYGYLNKDLLKKELSDNRYRYAHWTFDRASTEVLRDDHADCEGVLRGAVKFGEAEGRKFATFDGRSYALVEGHVVDMRNGTFDLELSWSGGTAAQRVFEFGDTDASLLLAILPGGRSAFVTRRGKESASVISGVALGANRWTRLSVSLLDGVARIFIDGKIVAEQKGFKFALDDIGARAGRIGAGVGGLGFQGKLDRLTVYRAGFGTAAEIPAP